MSKDASQTRESIKVQDLKGETASSLGIVHRCWKHSLLSWPFVMSQSAAVFPIDFRFRFAMSEPNELCWG